MAHLSFCSSLDDTMTGYPHCDCGENPPMPKTNKEKQEDFRARMALLGLKEVRGIYLPEALHPVLKEQAQKLLEKHQQEDSSSAS
jgi:hypothetical protein